MATRRPTTAEAISQMQEHIITEGGRLDRIESKIDKLAETMVSLARAEEKLISLETDRITIAERLNKHSDRIDKVESKVEKNEGTLSVIGRVFWICLTAFVGAAAVQYLM